MIRMLSAGFLFLCAVLGLSGVAFATEYPSQVISCSTTFPALPHYAGSENKMTIVVIGGELIAKLTQQDGIYSRSSQVPAKLRTETVREGITDEMEDSDTLNPTEKLIKNAYLLTQKPEYKGILSAGFNLRKVRSAKTYYVSRGTRGIPAIVVAKDESGNDLGSFLMSTFVTPCK